jgi:hypothetical protein
LRTFTPGAEEAAGTEEFSFLLFVPECLEFQFRVYGRRGVAGRISNVVTTAWKVSEQSSSIFSRFSLCSLKYTSVKSFVLYRRIDEVLFPLENLQWSSSSSSSSFSSARSEPIYALQ